MTKTLKIKSYPNHYQDTFLIVRKTANYLSVGDDVKLLEYGSENFITMARVVFKDTIKLREINPLHSYLAKQTDPTTFREILTMWDDEYKTTDYLDVLVFAKAHLTLGKI